MRARDGWRGPVTVSADAPLAPVPAGPAAVGCSVGSPLGCAVGPPVGDGLGEALGDGLGSGAAPSASPTLTGSWSEAR